MREFAPIGVCNNDGARILQHSAADPLHNLVRRKFQFEVHIHCSGKPFECPERWIDFIEKAYGETTLGEKVHRFADRRIEIDLDDGVKHNNEIFADVLAKV